MIGLREDQRERAQLVGKINALFAQLRDAFGASGPVVVGGLAVASRPARHNKLVAAGLRPAAGSPASKAAG